MTELVGYDITSGEARRLLDKRKARIELVEPLPVNPKDMLPIDLPSSNPSENRLALQKGLNLACGREFTIDGPVTNVKEAERGFLFPIGSWVIDSPLIVRAVTGFEWLGQGHQAQLDISEDMESPLLLDGLKASMLKTFRMGISPIVRPSTATTHCKYGIKSYVSDLTSSTNKNIVFDHIEWNGLNCEIALALNPDSSNIETVTNEYRQLTFSGAWRANTDVMQQGVLVDPNDDPLDPASRRKHVLCIQIANPNGGSANTLSHLFTGTRFSGWAQAIQNTGIDGVSFITPSFAQIGLALQTTGTSTTTINDFRIESTHRMQDNDVGGNVMSTTVWRDGQMGYAHSVDENWIKWLGAGSLILDNIKAKNKPGEFLPKIVCTGSAEHHIRLDDVYVHGAATPEDWVTPSAGTRVSSRAWGLLNTGANSLNRIIYPNSKFTWNFVTGDWDTSGARDEIILPATTHRMGPSPDVGEIISSTPLPPGFQRSIDDASGAVKLSCDSGGAFSGKVRVF